MTITSRVQQELVEAVPQADMAVRRTLKKNTRAMKERAAARVARAGKAVAAVGTGQNKGKAWTREEHELFLMALDAFPSGPWSAIASFVGTKDSRQAMTHAQKYRQKHERRQRGLRNANKGKRSAKKQQSKTKKQQRASATAPVLVPAASIVQRNEEYTEVKVDAHTQAQPETASASATEASSGFTAMLEGLPNLSLTKQLSDSPRSGEDGAARTAELDPFAPVSAADSAFALPLNAGAGWDDFKIDSSSIMEIFAEFEPVGTTAWPEMWSTNSLEEVSMSNMQFDLFSENYAAV